MPPADSEGELSTLEERRRRLYAPATPSTAPRTPLGKGTRFLPHAWKESLAQYALPARPAHIKLATRFFISALAFFGLSLLIAGYLLYFGGNSVSVNNIQISVQGPSTVAGGDTVPLTIAVTNSNPVDLENATLEADFPPGTRSADNVLNPLTAYDQNLGTIKSGETVTQSVKAVVFGSSGSALTIPISLTYGTTGSNATFVKKYSYPLAISSTPLSISAAAVAETTAGKPFTITLEVRSNATVPIDGVGVEASYPLGFSLTNSSVTATGSLFPLGTLAPGAEQTITLTGTLDGQDGDTRTFHFSVGTGTADGALALTYMTQDASVSITAPFLDTSLALNGSPLSTATLMPGASESVTLSYTNTLPTDLTDASVAVTLTGSAVDYSSIETQNGFYDSNTHTITFSKDTDPALADLASGASGVGTFNFKTVPASSFGTAPAVTFTTSVAGTRQGESNVPEQISDSTTDTIKAATAVEFAAYTTHTTGPFVNSGPVPPIVGQPTTYAITWGIKDGGNAVAGAVVKATLPSYVTYTGQTSGQGQITFDPQSDEVTWTAGDLAQGASAQASFQVSITPSTSQRGGPPQLSSAAAFTGYDRFAGVQVTAAADPVTTETTGDPGYQPGFGTVQ